MRLILYTGTRWCVPCRILQAMLRKYPELALLIDRTVDFSINEPRLIGEKGVKVRAVPSLWQDGVQMVTGEMDIIAELKRIKHERDRATEGVGQTADDQG